MHVATENDPETLHVTRTSISHETTVVGLFQTSLVKRIVVFLTYSQ